MNMFSQSASKSIWKIMVICFMAFVSGCAVFFPAHPNSGDTEGESVKVEILKVPPDATSVYSAMNKIREKLGESKRVNSQELTKDFIGCLQKKEAWTTCQEETGLKNSTKTGQTTLFTGLEVAVATAIINLAIDAAADAIKEEGSKHEANFGTKGIKKDFWVKSSNPKTGCINEEHNRKPADKPLDKCESLIEFLRITRTTKEFNEDTKPAFELILYFKEEIKDTKEYFVYPIRYITRSAKAKVLDSWCNPFAYRNGFDGLGCAVGYIPPLIAIKFFQDGKSSIQTNALVSMDGHWRRDQKGYSEPINRVGFSVSDYSINDNNKTKEPEMKIFGREGKLVETPIAWVNGIPVSQGEDGSVTSNGTYTLEVKVGEIDQAKVEKMTKAFSGLLSDNKDKITSEIIKNVTGGDSQNK